MLSKAIILIPLILTIIGCGRSNQDSTVVADSTEASASEAINSKAETYPQVLNDSSTVHLVKWKEISMSEYGPSYIFEDHTGKTITIQLIETPGFDFQKNDYFTATYSDESVFPSVKINSNVASSWYKITLVESYRELSGTGGEFPIITAIEIVK